MAEKKRIRGGKPWPVRAGDADGAQIGQITTAIYSPRFKCNIGLSMIERGFWQPGQPVKVLSADGRDCNGRVTALPFETSANWAMDPG